jgi:hypothetical protein
VRLRLLGEDGLFLFGPEQRKMHAFGQSLGSEILWLGAGRNSFDGLRWQESYLQTAFKAAAVSISDSRRFLH